MRKIAIYILLLFISIPTYGLGIELSSEVSEVQEWESFDIIIDIDTSGQDEIALDTIGWIENFDILAQSRSQRFVSINWETETQDRLLFTLIPKSIWDFTLWPVSAVSSGSTINSNTVDVSVVWEANTWIVNQRDQEEDILDIFESTDRKLSFNYIPFLLWGFLIVFFILIQRFFRKSDKQIDLVSDSEVEISQHDKLIAELKSLKKVSSKLEKTDFYSQFNGIMRDFFSVLWYKNTQKMTLKEIQKLGISNKEILWIFAQSYRSEFDTKSDTLPERKRLIDSFIKQLQK